MLAKYVAEGKINSSFQLDLAINYLKKILTDKVDTADFDKSIGVNFDVSGIFL
jgi:hypothetical protein